MKYEFRQTGEDGELILSGELTVHHAAELHPILLRSLEMVDRLTLRIGDVEGADITFLQLLCSAHQTSMARGKELLMDGETGPAFRRLVEETGYACHTLCKHNPGQGCFWVTQAHCRTGKAVIGGETAGEAVP